MIEASTFATILNVLAGTTILLLGRRLFWLVVAVGGFLAAFEVVPVLMPDSSEWVIILVSLLAGALGAALAIGLQYGAAALMGFVAGSYVGATLVPQLDSNGGGWISLIGGIIGAVLMVMLFDWALIGLSALAGARAVLLPFELQGTIGVVLWLLLSMVGVAVQASMLAPAERFRRAP